ncbi:PD-(D/E)XK nuclease family protein [Candidatus Omnitrophota bacterium]
MRCWRKNIAIKAIAIVLIVSFSFQNIVWADPQIGRRAPSYTLQVQSSFNPIENPLLLHESLVRTPLKYLIETIDELGEGVKKFNRRITPPIHDRFLPVLDFDRKYRDEEGKRWIIPCSVIDTEEGHYWRTEAVVSDDRSIELRRSVRRSVDEGEDEIDTSYGEEPISRAPDSEAEKAKDEQNSVLEQQPLPKRFRHMVGKEEPFITKFLKVIENELRTWGSLSETEIQLKLIDRACRILFLPWIILIIAATKKISVREVMKNVVQRIDREWDRDDKETWLAREIGKENITPAWRKFPLERLKRRKELCAEIDKEFNLANVKKSEYELKYGPARMKRKEASVSPKAPDMRFVDPDFLRDISKKASSKEEEIRLVVFNLAGILVSPEHEKISGEMIRRLKWLDERGIKICILTTGVHARVRDKVLRYLSEELRGKIDVLSEAGVPTERKIVRGKREKDMLDKIFMKVLENPKFKIKQSGVTYHKRSVIFEFKSKKTKSEDVAAAIKKMLEKKKFKGRSLSERLFVSVNKTDSELKEVMITAGHAGETLPQYLDNLDKKLEINPKRTLFIGRWFGPWSSNQFALKALGEDLNVVQVNSLTDTWRVLDAILMKKDKYKTKKERRRVHPALYKSGDESDLVVQFINADEGDGILITTPDGKNILIDAGTGVAEYLHNAGITEIHQFVITHGHEDHIKEFTKILDQCKVHSVVDSGYPLVHGQWAGTVLAETEKRGIKLISEVREGYEFDKEWWGEHVYAKVLSPPRKKSVEDELKKASEADSSYVNNKSIVIFMSRKTKDKDKKGVSFLFTGDIGEEVEEELCRNYPELLKDVDVYQEAHHGSLASSGKKRRATVKPGGIGVAIMPKSKRRSSDIYSEKVLAARLGGHSKFFSTRTEGPICIRANEKGEYAAYAIKQRELGAFGDYPANLALTEEESKRPALTLPVSIGNGDVSIQRPQSSYFNDTSFEGLRSVLIKWLALLGHAPPLEKFQIRFSGQDNIARTEKGVIWLSWGVIRLLLMNDQSINNFLVQVLYHEGLHLSGKREADALEKTKEWLSKQTKIYRDTMQVLKNPPKGFKAPKELLPFLKKKTKITSHTQISLFEKCRRAYEAKYEPKYGDHSKPGEKKATIEQATGICVHEVMEKLYKDMQYKGRPPSLEELLAHYDKLWEEKVTRVKDNIIIAKKDKKAKKGKIIDGHYNRGKKCVEDYYKYYLPSERSRTIAVEMMIWLDYDGTGRNRAMGFIDRLAVRREKDKEGKEREIWEIHDYKTSEKIPTQEELDQDKQLARYQIAIQRMWPQAENVELIWHYMGRDKEGTMISKRTPEELQKLIEEDLEVLEEMETTKERPAKKSRLCPWCEHKEDCSVYKGEAVPSGKEAKGEQEKTKKRTYTKKEIGQLVDEYVTSYTERKEKKDALKERNEALEGLEEKLAEYSRREGVLDLLGLNAIVKLSEKDSLKLPGKETLARKELEEKLIKAGIKDVFGLNAGAVQRLIEAHPELGKELGGLERFVEETESFRINISENEKQPKPKAKKGSRKSAKETTQRENAPKKKGFLGLHRIETLPEAQSEQFSHSRLMQATTCLFAYYMKYVLRKKEVHDTAEAFLGKVFHATMEKLYTDLKDGKKFSSKEEAKKYAEEEYKKQWEEGSKNIVIVRKDMELDDYHRLGIKFITDYCERHWPFDRDETLLVEGKLDIDLNIDGKYGKEKYELKGFVDLVRLSVREKDGKKIYEIHDYKTSRRFPTQEKVDKDDDQYRQLAIYDLGIRQKYNLGKEDEVRLIWHYVAFNREIRSKRTPQQLEKLRDDIVEEIREIRELEQFLPNKTPLCPWCRHKNSCPLFKHIQKIKSLPDGQAREDEGYKLAGKYAAIHEKAKQLKAEIKQLEEKLDGVKEKIVTHAKDSKKETLILVGSTHKLTLKRKPGSKLTEDDTNKNLLALVLKRNASDWYGATRLISQALLKMYEKGELPSEIVEIVKKLVTPKISVRVHQDEDLEGDGEEKKEKEGEEGEVISKEMDEGFAAGLGVYGEEEVDVKVQRKMTSTISQAYSKKRERIFTFAGLDDEVKKELKADTELMELLDSEKIRFVAPSDIKNNSPPANWYETVKDSFLWSEPARRLSDTRIIPTKFILSYAKNGEIYIPLPLVPFLVKAKHLDFFKRLVKFEVDNVKRQKARKKENIDKAKELAKEFLILKVFEEELAWIDTEKMRDFVMEALKLAPDYVWDSPSSVTAKYHPKDETRLGGLILHTKRVFETALKIAFLHDLPPEQRDRLLVSSLLHDMAKYGHTDEIYNDPSDKEGKKRKKHYRIHPQLVRIMTKSLSEKSEYPFYGGIIRLVEGHEGRWSCKPRDKNKESKESAALLESYGGKWTELEEGYKPGTDMQWLMHLADYGVARRYALDVDALIAHHYKLVTELGYSFEEATRFIQKQDSARKLLGKMEGPPDPKKEELLLRGKEKILKANVNSEEAGKIASEIVDDFIPEIATKKETPQLKSSKFTPTLFLDKERMFLRDLCRAEEASLSLVEMLLSVALVKKQLVLAFDQTMGGYHSSEILAALKVLKRLKTKPKFKKLLEKVEIITAHPSQFPSKLQEYIGKEGTEVFMFARQIQRDEGLKRIEKNANIHAAYIDENISQRISSDAPYYPLAEIVTITLAQFINPNTIHNKQVIAMLKALYIDPAIEEKGNMLIFKLLPGADILPARELIDRYAALKRFLKAA